MARPSYQQAHAQINATLISTAAAATSLAQRTAKRRLDGSTARESQAARRKTAIVSNVTIPNGMATSVKTHALQDVRMISATKQTDSAKAVARTVSSERSAISNARAAAKVVAATKKMLNATMDARRAGVETSVMCLAQKALALKGATVKLASQNLACLAAIRSNSK